MNPEEKYWNPVLETLPQEKLRQLQLNKFKKIFKWAYDNSKFYRKIYGNAGIEPGDIRKFEDIQKVPKIEKAMLREAQGKDPFPYGDLLSVPLEKVTAFRQTSGTTGQPVYWGDTWEDWESGVEGYCYALYAQGYRDNDRLFLPFGYNIFYAFWSAHYAAEKLGCEVVPGGILNTEARILKMKEIRATCMAATPTYALAMADTARMKLNLDPRKDLFVKRITTAGEPGGSIPATRKRLEDAWGAKVFDQVGTTETGHWGWECQEQSGVHINDALMLVEVEDVETGKNIDQTGGKGRLVITNLNRFGQPCIRFDTKDIVKLKSDRCACGRTFRQLEGGVIGRSDDITKVKGVLFAPSACEEVIRSIPELGDEYQIVVTRNGNEDNITLKLEAKPDYKNQIEAIKAKLTDQLRLKTNIGYSFEFYDYGTLPRSDAKAKRFKDLRQH